MASGEETLESLMADLGIEPTDNPIELLRKLKEIIQCAVCLTIPSCKVFQCPNGHLTCERCSGHVTTCPTCRDPLNFHTRIRNLVVEQAIAVIRPLKPCRNTGCHVRSPMEDLEEHMKSCEYRIVPCPFQRGCIKPHMAVNEVLDHLGASRPGLMMDMYPGGRRILCDFNITQTQRKTKDFKDFRVEGYQGGEFEMVNSYVHAWVRIIGNDEKAHRFRAKITIGDDSHTTITHSGKVFPIDMGIDDILEGDDGVLVFHMDDKVGRKFLKPLDDGKMAISISHSRD